MAGSSDLLITGGQIWTGRPGRPWVEALAVREGRIAAAGPLSQVRAVCGPGAESLDLHGRAVVPGFQDAHCHPVSGGLQARQCNLEGMLSAAACQEAVRAFIDSHPETEWVTGKGWSMETFPGGTPAALVLDQVTGSRPAYLVNRDGHSAWVNSEALRRAGVDGSSADPPHGRIERDPGGAPQGTLHEAAMELVSRLLPDPGPEALVAALEDAQRHLHSLGITGWQDAMVDAPIETAYAQLAARGGLTARVRLALWWERSRGLEQIPELVARRDRLGGLGLAAGSVKLMLDGVVETYTAALLEPYLDPHPGHPGQLGSGHLFVEPEMAQAAVTELDRQGVQVHFHAIGDRAVRLALDSVQAARRAPHNQGPRRRPDHPRHHVAHIQLLDPGDVGRFRQLGVVANMQPYWACYEPQMTELTLPFLGPERGALQYPFLSLLSSGATLAAGSDWPVSTANPLEEMAVAAARRLPAPAPGQNPLEATFIPEERLPLEVALTAFTAGSAYVNYLEASCGTLEPGKQADLAVLAHDPFDVGLAHLPQARVELTMVAGRVVWDRGVV